LRNGRSRSVTTIWPRSGFIGASSPTIGASRMLALPAASATLPARTSPRGVLRRQGYVEEG